MNIGTWFNVRVFDRWQWLELRRQWVSNYLIGEIEWRFRFLITSRVIVQSTGKYGMLLNLVQPHSKFSRRKRRKYF